MEPSNSGHEGTLLGNGIVGVLAETVSVWERRVPLTPTHCARLLTGNINSGKVTRIIVQPSTKRIYNDELYEAAGCEISQDLSGCGLIFGVKQPELEMILPDRAYAFFSHTRKGQKENMPLLDKIIAVKATLYDYELIVGHGKRLLAFGRFAGRAGMIDFLHGLGQRYLYLGYTTPFLSVGASFMYLSLAEAKDAVTSVGKEISTLGLPMEIGPLVFVFTGAGNVSEGAQEILKLLPHKFVKPSQLQEIFERKNDEMQLGPTSKRGFQVYGCVITSQDMVEHKHGNTFDKADYYVNPSNYRPVFHEKIAPYASVIVNCMYWEPKFPRLLSSAQLQEMTSIPQPEERSNIPRLVGICDISCDIGGSIEFVNKATSIDSPFFRYDPVHSSYHDDIKGTGGMICSAVDILPTEFPKEASQHFGDILSEYVHDLASIKDIKDLPEHLKGACLVHGGSLTSPFEYIPRLKSSGSV